VPPTFTQLCADLDGIPATRLSDEQDLAGLLLAAANAAGLAPATSPVVRTGPTGIDAVLLCYGGHVTLHGVPEAGCCFVDLAGLGASPLQRGLDVVLRRLGAHQVRSDGRQRGLRPEAAATDGE
jgi:S-adenosylmethionine/arginine decarboxylase-like enzyme